jgi:multidrug efflux system membrane fusion protein
VLGAALGAACSPKPTKPPRQVVSVAVVTARRATVPYTIEANGVVTPMQSVAISPQVDGIIQAVSFEEGQEVTQGQVLFRIDPRPYRNAYDLAAAALTRDSLTAANAQREVERYAPLAAQNFVAKEQADQLNATAGSALAAVRADAATLATARFNLENTTITAPISGKTGALLVRAGNLVRAAGSSPLVVINQVRPILVRFAVPASELELVLQYGAQGGLPVTAVPGGARPSPGAADSSGGSLPSLDAPSALGGAQATPQGGGPSAGSGLVENGTLSFVDNAVDTTTETVMLKARFANISGRLWTGQFASTSVKLFDEKEALIIPAQCVVTGQRGTYVYVIDSAMNARQQSVVVERASGDIVIIGSGLTGGEKVVTDGQSRLNPGTAVTIRSPNGAGGPGGASGGGRGGRGGRGRGGRGGGTDSASTGGKGRGTRSGRATPP